MWQKLRKGLHVDKTGVLMKLCYFFVMGKEGAIKPFLTVFLTSIGLHLKEASMISGLQFVASILSTQIFAWIADKTGRTRAVFALVTSIATLIIFPLPWIATLTNQSASRSFNISNNSLMEIQQPFVMYQNKLFYNMLCFVIIGFAFSNPLMGFVDSFVMNIIQSAPESYDYGHQRLFGVLGFGLLNFAASIISEFNMTSNLSPYLGVFIVFLTSMVFLAPTGVALARKGPSELNRRSSDVTLQSNNKKKLLKTLFVTFLDMSNFMFLLSFFVAGICNTAIVGFLFKLMADELNASKTVMGISMLVASLAEIALLLFSTRILRLLRNPMDGVIIAVLLYALRFLLISLLENPWYIVMTQILNAPTFSLCWASGVAHAQSISPPEIVVSMYSLLNNVFFNIAGLVGLWAGGLIYDANGSKSFFLFMACFAGGWFLLTFIYYQAILRMRHICAPKTKEQVQGSVLTLESVF